ALLEMAEDQTPDELWVQAREALMQAAKNGKFQPRCVAFRERVYTSHEEAGNEDGGNIDEMPHELEITVSEIQQALWKVSMNKSPGVDDIPVELIKAAGEAGVSMMTLCNKIWKSRIWPTEWKASLFIPHFKKGDNKDCKNYGTISLIPHASKVLLHISQRLESYAAREIPTEQAGFVKGRRTRDHIANLRHIIEKDHEFKHPLYLCFVDYSKAFDTVQHNKLECFVENGHSEALDTPT
ncbi:uncharacterized protein LOC134789282, partial [Penaeus indicus]|uniref:uncharacterized protein LOC134789282 n=1 Tax=Penaeus indicus TaxID=29960 RepID=UPI00300D7E1E